MYILCNCFLYKFVDFVIFIGHCNKEEDLKCQTYSSSVVLIDSPRILSKWIPYSHMTQNISGSIDKGWGTTVLRRLAVVPILFLEYQGYKNFLPGAAQPRPLMSLHSQKSISEGCCGSEDPGDELTLAYGQVIFGDHLV